MRENIKNMGGIFPMPVLMIATYNQDYSVNVMNAAWGMMYESDMVILNLSNNHKTYKNILERKAFTVSIADTNHVKEADYFGIVSGNNIKNKLESVGLTSLKSKFVDAPVVNEFPICLECEFLEDTSAGVIGKVVNISVDSKVMEDGKINIEKVKAIAYDPYTNGYYEVSKRVADAFKVGYELKK